MMALEAAGMHRQPSTSSVSPLSTPDGYGECRTPKSNRVRASSAAGTLPVTPRRLDQTPPSSMYQSPSEASMASLTRSVVAAAAAAEYSSSRPIQQRLFEPMHETYEPAGQPYFTPNYAPYASPTYATYDDASGPGLFDPSAMPMGMYRSQSSMSAFSAASSACATPTAGCFDTPGEYSGEPPHTANFPSFAAEIETRRTSAPFHGERFSRPQFQRTASCPSDFIQNFDQQVQLREPELRPAPPPSDLCMRRESSKRRRPKLSPLGVGMQRSQSSMGHVPPHSAAESRRFEHILPRTPLRRANSSAGFLPHVVAGKNISPRSSANKQGGYNKSTGPPTPVSPFKQQLPDGKIIKLEHRNNVATIVVQEESVLTSPPMTPSPPKTETRSLSLPSSVPSLASDESSTSFDGQQFDDLFDILSTSASGPESDMFATTLPLRPATTPATQDPCSPSPLLDFGSLGEFVDAAF